MESSFFQHAMFRGNSLYSVHSMGKPISPQPLSAGTLVPSVLPSQAVLVVSGFPSHDQAFLMARAPFQPSLADFFLLSSLTCKINNRVLLIPLLINILS